MLHAPETTSDLIDLIYASLVGEATWQQFLNKLNETLPGAASTLFFHDHRTGQGAASLASGFDPVALRDYSAHYSSINPWMQKLAETPIGIGITGEQLIDRRCFLRHEYYSFINGFGFEAGIGATLFHDSSCSFLISTLTSSADADRNDAAARQLTMLAPHLRRAFRHYRTNRFDNVEAGITASLFDALDVGVIVVGEGLKIRTASETGRSWLAAGEHVRMSALGTLRVVDTAAQEMLATMLARGYAGPRTWASYLPGAKLSLIRVLQDQISEYLAGTSVILVMETLPKSPQPGDLAALARALKLSNAEARVFIEIAGGQSIAQIAEKAELARETIRSQLKAVYAKTGVSSQAALVRLATSARF
ncbi:hypothetical protein ASE63_21970 [Bosea sp. Root381]|uniref:helix-turn-helix transcriptional regulator n=1 Tax=Bosea sp. Root381 TaxID=1736524 RepID=UPI0006FCF1C5|nr:LuxR C-terminal-related transcriptional regulator [Bosea sp. Root381]KRE08002.1 hypothetical protein ASE63_21970 [Bosea sp. Root381]